MFAAVKKAPVTIASKVSRSPTPSGVTSALGGSSSTGSAAATAPAYPSSSWATDAPVAGPSSSSSATSPVRRFARPAKPAPLSKGSKLPPTTAAPATAAVPEPSTTTGDTTSSSGSSSSPALPKRRTASSFLLLPLGEAPSPVATEPDLARSTEAMLRAFGQAVPYPAQLPQHVLSFLLAYPTATRRRHSVANVDFYTGRVGGPDYEGRGFRRNWRARDNPPSKDSPSGYGISWCLEQLHNDPSRMFKEPQLWPWLFPLPHYGADMYSQPLQAHEIEPILNSVNAVRRLERAHALTLRMLGIRLADPGTGLLTPTFDSADLFPVFTDPATAKRASAILTRCLQSLTILSPDVASKSSFLRHMPSTIGFLIAAHNEGLLDLARGTDAGTGLEKEWGLSIINRELREEIMALALARKDHSAPSSATDDAPTWGFAQYERWVVHQNLQHGRLRQRFRDILLPLPSAGPGEPAPFESEQAKEDRWVELVLARLKTQAAELEFKDQVRKGVIKVEKTPAQAEGSDPEPQAPVSSALDV